VLPGEETRFRVVLAAGVEQAERLGGLETYAAVVLVQFDV
jgi:hypothetical protein